MAISIKSNLNAGMAPSFLDYLEVHLGRQTGGIKKKALGAFVLEEDRTQL